MSRDKQICNFCNHEQKSGLMMAGNDCYICKDCIEIFADIVDNNSLYKSGRMRFDLSRFQNPGQVEIILLRLLAIEANSQSALDQIDGYSEGIYDHVMEKQQPSQPLPLLRDPRKIVDGFQDRIAAFELLYTFQEIEKLDSLRFGIMLDSFKDLAERLRKKAQANSPPNLAPDSGPDDLPDIVA